MRKLTYKNIVKILSHKVVLSLLLVLFGSFALFWQSPSASAQYQVTTIGQYPRPDTSNVSRPANSDFWNGINCGGNIGRSIPGVTNCVPANGFVDNTTSGQKPDFIWQENGSDLTYNQYDNGKTMPNGQTCPTFNISQGIPIVPANGPASPLVSDINSCWTVQRGAGGPGQFSNYEVVAPLWEAQSGSIQVTVVNACHTPKDDNGWEDHMFRAPNWGGVGQISVYSSAGNSINSSNGQCTGNDLVLQIPFSDFSAASDLGSDLYRAKVTVKDGSVEDSVKMFSVAVSGAGVYIGPYPNADVNLRNPGADYYWGPMAQCLNANPKILSNCPSAFSGNFGGGYRNINVPNDSTQDQRAVYNSSNDYGDKRQSSDGLAHNRFSFYFSTTACQVTPTTLKWGDWNNVGSPVQTSSEDWYLMDTASGNYWSPGGWSGIKSTFTSLGNGQATINANGGLTPGHVYEWTWENVDRAHGVSVQLPYSEFTATPGYDNSAVCPQPPAQVCRQYVLPDDGKAYDAPTNIARSISGNVWYRVTVLSSNSVWKQAGVGPAENDTTNSTPDQNNTTYYGGYSAPGPYQSAPIHSGSGTVNYNLNLPPPTGPDRKIYVEYWVKINSTTWQYHYFYQTITNCYSAVCNLYSIDNQWPGEPVNDVRAGSTYYLYYTMTNTGKDRLDAPYPGTGNYPSLTSSDTSPPNNNIYENLNAAWRWDGSNWVPQTAGISYPIQFTMQAPSGSTTQTFSTYPDYYGLTALGSPCNQTMNVYQPFTVNPFANATYDNDEDPTQVTYSTGEDTSGQSQNVAVNVPTSSCFYKQTAPSNTCSGGGLIVAGPVGGGTYPPNAKTYTLGPNAVLSPVPGPIFAGLTYCAEIDAGYTQGWVGPGGPGDVTATNGPDNVKACPNVVNKPYFKVFNNGVQAGGAFSANDPSCSGGGTLASWNNNTGLNPAYDFGSSAQFSALALDNIVGFASAQNSQSANSGPVTGTGLSFANDWGGPVSYDAYSPSLGGQYGSTNCFTDWQQGSGGDRQSFGSNKTINGMTIGVGDNKSYFVNGDAYISGNIAYSGSGGGWTKGNVPSFVLHATGNIYIDPNVTHLDGIYVSTGRGKHIYTCSDAADGNPFAAMPKDELYANCNKQLTIVGNFEADNVDLMRTYGSLRDEKPLSLSNNAKPLYRFWHTSDGVHINAIYLQLNNPAPPGGGGSGWNQGGPDLLGYAYAPRSPSVDVNDPPATEANCQAGTTPLVGETHTDGTDNLYNTYQGTLAGEVKTYYNPTIVACIYPKNAPVSGTQKIDRVFAWAYKGSTVHYIETESPPVTFPPSDCAGPPETSGNLYCEGTPMGYTLISNVAIEIPPFMPLHCSNAGAVPTNVTCAAEVFQFSPEVYLSSPALQPPGNGTPEQTITSLPPVL